MYIHCFPHRMIVEALPPGPFCVVGKKIKLRELKSENHCGNKFDPIKITNVKKTKSVIVAEFLFWLQFTNQVLILPFFPINMIFFVLKKICLQHIINNNIVNTMGISK